MPLPPISFPTLGWQVIDWIEAMLCHGPGDVQGDEQVIDDEIALHICWLYRLYPRDHKLAGRRMIHHGVLSRPKGRAKSEIAGEVVWAEALGPVRFDGWDANGDPVGKPVTYPFIRCLATEEEQSGNTYDNVVYMGQHGAVADEYAIDVGLTRTFIKEPGGGEIRPSTSGDASKDGGKESFAVADEPHLYITRGLREMYRTVARNTGKRKAAQPWMYDTTTAHAEGEHSIAEHNWEQFAELPIEEAVTAKGVLFDHRQGDEPKRFGDDRSLIKAMRAGYGPAAEWMDFLHICRIIREAEDPETEAFRYWLNIPRRAKRTWLASGEIQSILTEDAPEMGSKIGLGFDGSENSDHTALWLATEDGLIIPVGIWTPEGADLGWHAEVNEAVDWTFNNFQVVRFYLDPPYWQEEAGKWAATYSDEDRRGSLPVAEFWTNAYAKMAVACGALRTAIRQEAARMNPTPLLTEPQTRNGKPLAVWHFENARTQKVRVKLEASAEEAHVVTKRRPGAPEKIDSVPSAVLARRAMDDARKLGELEEPEYGRAAW